jgi:hypothetical protein
LTAAPAESGIGLSSPSLAPIPASGGRHEAFDMARTTAGVPSVAAALVLTIGSACNVSTLPPGGLAEQKNLSMIGAELKIRVRGMLGPAIAAIEQAADSAARRCGDNPTAVMGALSWKLGAIPQIQDTLLLTDPAIAFADGWAYAIQLQTFLAGEGGRAVLGECHAEAAAAMGRIVDRGREIANELDPANEAQAEARIRDWAVKHPLRGLELPRPSFAPELAAGVARQNLGVLASVGVALESLDDLTYRIAAYRETLLKEVRWAGELAALQAGGSDAASQALGDLDRISAAVDRLGVLAAQMPSLMERERRAVLGEVRGEREAVLGDLRSEREAVLADVDRQRGETLRFLQSERAAVLADVQALGQATLDQGTAQVERVVDHAFLRAAQLSVALLLLVALAAGLGAWVVVHSAGWRWRRPRDA